MALVACGDSGTPASTEAFFRRPSHPYTVRLLESLPNPQGDIREIGGEIPALVDPPGGCRFHPRCANALEICRRAFPEETSLGPGHTLHCHNPVRQKAVA